MSDKNRNFLVIFDINPATPKRLGDALPSIVEILRDGSVESPELAFRSTGGDHFGYFIQSALNPHQLRVLIDSPKTASPPLSGSDKYLIVELGQTFFGHQGFSRAATWLQRHEI